LSCDTSEQACYSDRPAFLHRPVGHWLPLATPFLLLKPCVARSPRIATTTAMPRWESCLGCVGEHRYLLYAGTSRRLPVGLRPIPSGQPSRQVPRRQRAGTADWLPLVLAEHRCRCTGSTPSRTTPPESCRARQRGNRARDFRFEASALKLGAPLSDNAGRLIAAWLSIGGSPRDPLGRTNRATLTRMARSIHVRLDDASAAALDIVRATEMTESEAVRAALQETAARRRVRSAIQREVAELANDPDDRAEMKTIREQLAELAPSSTE
jgi:hypothetical protein